MSNYEENKTTLIEWRDWAISNLDPSAGAIMWAVSTINDQEKQLATARAEVATLNYTIDYLRKNSLHAATILDNGITPAEEESR